MSSPSIFISYSHKDQEWKDRVATHLGVLKMENLLDVWDDQRIEAGDDWRSEIENAINKANIAILIISANFLTSKFILDEEVPKLLERRLNEGVRVIPLIAKPCAWKQVKWLSSIQARPKEGKPLSAGTEHQIDIDLSGLANEVAEILKRAGIISIPEKTIYLPPDRVSLAKLPSTLPRLFGRENFIDYLDNAWVTHNINIITFVGWGGVGKSAIVNYWLTKIAKDHYRGAERVYGWSFYSQGAEEGRQISADQFIESALAWFGDPDPNLGSPWNKGERLAELVKQSRALIILDGIEPLQNPPPLETGRIKDPSLVAFLRELARQNPGLVIITSRLTVEDLKDSFGDTVIEHKLDNLGAEAGAEYLEYLGVQGAKDELKEASNEFDGHALSLTLMGTYIKVVHHGDIRKRTEIPRLIDERKQGSHAKRILKSYEIMLSGKPELGVLRIMGLFDRPAEQGALSSLRQEPIIEGLTDVLHKLSEVDWQYAVNNLRELHLLSSPLSLSTLESFTQDNTLDCHPLLREYFSEQLRETNPEAWREGNKRLYEFYRDSTKEFPDTIQEMAPLFAAVMHGCRAGRYQETLDEVYWRRIHREHIHFDVKKLGAFNEDLSVLSGFFNKPWDSPLNTLRDESRAMVLNIAGFDMRALGRLDEAIHLMVSGLDIDNERGDWINAAEDSNNLSEIYLAAGDLLQAQTFAEQSVEFADRSENDFYKMALRTTLADTLSRMGRFTEAEALFVFAEELQKKRKPQFWLLFSVWGFRYCDFLLSHGKYQEVQKRMKYLLEWRMPTDSLLEIALEDLLCGRAYLLQSKLENTGDYSQSVTYLDNAVSGLHKAGEQIYLVLGLLARAECHRVTGSLDKAQIDLNEAVTITSRGRMRLFLADCYLEYARLYLANDKKENARNNWETAKNMIMEMGYHQRDKDLRDLEDYFK